MAQRVSKRVKAQAIRDARERKSQFSPLRCARCGDEGVDGGLRLHRNDLVCAVCAPSGPDND
jgi:formylmethanofuran dehydrogenase subunit E